MIQNTGKKFRKPKIVAKLEKQENKKRLDKYLNSHTQEPSKWQFISSIITSKNTTKYYKPDHNLADISQGFKTLFNHNPEEANIDQYILSIIKTTNLLLNARKENTIKLKKSYTED